MSFWVIVIGIILFLGWLGQFRTGSASTTHASKPPSRLQQTIATTKAAAMPPPHVANQPQGLLGELNESLSRVQAVQEATSRLQRDMSLERVLIEAAMRTAETRLAADQARRAMTPEGRRIYDQAFKRLQGLDLGSAGGSTLVPDYRKPDFTFPQTHYGSDVAEAIREKIAALQDERNTFIVEIKTRIASSNLAPNVLTALHELGSRKASASLRSVLGLSIMDLLPDSDRLTSFTARGASTAHPLPPPTPVAPASSTAPPVDRPLTHTAAIRAEAEARGINCLLHFTDLRSLPRILQTGLQSVAAMRAAGTPFRFNDHLRLDGQPDGISLSIGHPNHRMFYKCRNTGPVRDWCVLVLDPAILWSLPVAFNRHNAADKRMTGLPLQQRRDPAALAAMFAPADGLPDRAAARLRPCDPTDVQAEVLVLAPIPAARITGIVFQNHANAAAHRTLLGPRRSFVHDRDPGFFSGRDYVRRAGWSF